PMIFALVLLFVTLAVLGTVLSPLWQQGGRAMTRGRYDRAVYRDQLNEIERDLARGMVRPEDAAAARREIERRILAAADEPDAPAAGAPRRSLAAILAVCAGAVALVAYMALGSPGLPDLPFANRVSPAAQAAMIQNMVSGLAAQLKDNPQDAQGWAMLGRSYAVLGETDKAIDAYEHARQLKPDDPTIALAEAAAMLADRKVEDPVPARAVALLKTVTARQPDQPMALWFLGLAAAQQRDFTQARDDWTHLLRVMPADAPERDTVNAALDAIKGK
ncbi:MAG: c-type cytochrome biogenesis protein CcmI, partial [Alphaproteobacteria bacterium]|nr:c-type cytochrome biogenesis protein CcmI [Alphaproteobacteria bacterium]